MDVGGGTAHISLRIHSDLQMTNPVVCVNPTLDMAKRTNSWSLSKMTHSWMLEGEQHTSHSIHSDLQMTNPVVSVNPMLDIAKKNGVMQLLRIFFKPNLNTHLKLCSCTL